MFTNNSLFKRDGSFELKPEAKTMLKNILKNQTFSNFSDLVGYTPNPEGPFPLPGPWPFPFFLRRQGPPWPQPAIGTYFYGKGIGYPNPDDPYPWPGPLGPLVRNLNEDFLIDHIQKTPLRKETFSVLDAIKRENLVFEAYKEMSVDLQNFQKEIDSKVKMLG